MCYSRLIAQILLSIHFYICALPTYNDWNGILARRLIPHTRNRFTILDALHVQPVASHGYGKLISLFPPLSQPLFAVLFAVALKTLAIVEARRPRV